MIYLKLYTWSCIFLSILHDVSIGGRQIRIRLTDRSLLYTRLNIIWLKNELFYLDQCLILIFLILLFFQLVLCVLWFFYRKFLIKCNISTKSNLYLAPKPLLPIALDLKIQHGVNSSFQKKKKNTCNKIETKILVQLVEKN